MRLPGGLVTTQNTELLLQEFLIWEVWGGVHGFAFLTNSQGKLMLLVQTTGLGIALYHLNMFIHLLICSFNHSIFTETLINASDTAYPPQNPALVTGI